MKSGTSLLVATLLLVAVVATSVAAALALGVLSPQTGAAPTATPTTSLAPTNPPTPSATASATIAPTASPTPSPSPSDSARPTPGGIYVVQEGDTLFLIGELFGVPWELIAQANALVEPYYIYPEQELVIPAPDASADPCAAFYIVQAGDTFYDIAYELGVSATDLEAANPQVVNLDDIKAGDRLNVPGGPDCPSPGTSPPASP